MVARARSSTGAILLALALAAGGCGTSGDGGEEAELTIYVSLPLRGASGSDGRDAADGARLALADAGSEAGDVEIRARFLDDTEGKGADARWTPAKAAANARAASEDSTAIAYLGDFESGATRASLPITNEARILQVSPASGAVDLVAPFAGSDELPEVQPGGERSFGRVIPSDDAQGRAAAAWAERLGARRIATLSDGSAYGDTVVFAFEGAIERATTTRRNTDLLFYGGVSGDEPASLLGRSRGELMVTDAQLSAEPSNTQPPGTYATSAALHPFQVARLPVGQRFDRRFRKRFGPPGPYAAYGYEAMAVILDSIDRASNPTNREAVIDAFFDTEDRDSILGPYSIDEVGDTTLDRISGYRIERDKATVVKELRVP